MNEIIDLKRENVLNLTDIWEKASRATGTFEENEVFSYGVGEFHWPNRLWFHQQVTPDLVSRLEADPVLANAPLLVLPSFDFDQGASFEVLEKGVGLPLLFQQTAMEVTLSEKFETHDRIHALLVEGVEQAVLWSTLFEQSFNYLIHPKVVEAIMTDIAFYIFMEGKQPIGTGILHFSGAIAGFHCVGVVPSARRKGFAEEIMRFLLNQAIDRGSTYGTLQASDMGKGLYERLGFVEQFEIRNYLLKGQV